MRAGKQFAPSIPRRTLGIQWPGGAGVAADPAVAGDDGVSVITWKPAILPSAPQAICAASDAFWNGIGTVMTV